MVGGVFPPSPREVGEDIRGREPDRQHASDEPPCSTSSRPMAGFRSNGCVRGMIGRRASGVPRDDIAIERGCPARKLPSRPKGPDPFAGTTEAIRAFSRGVRETGRAAAQ